MGKHHRKGARIENGKRLAPEHKNGRQQKQRKAERARKSALYPFMEKIITSRLHTQAHRLVPCDEMFARVRTKMNGILPGLHKLFDTGAPPFYGMGFIDSCTDKDVHPHVVALRREFPQSSTVLARTITDGCKINKIKADLKVNLEPIFTEFIDSWAEDMFAKLSEPLHVDDEAESESEPDSDASQASEEEVEEEDASDSE